MSEWPPIGTPLWYKAQKLCFKIHKQRDNPIPCTRCRRKVRDEHDNKLEEIAQEVNA